VATATTKVQEPGRLGETPGTRPTGAPTPSLWWQRYWPDLLIAGALAVVAFLVRRHGLPTDGLWLDDDFVAAGLHASPSQLLTAGIDHPGFLVFLDGWNVVTGGSDAGLTYPALAAGVLSGPFLFLALRAIGYERSIGALFGALLAAAATDIVYSGRVKTYTVDLLIVLGLAMVLPRLTRLKWGWQIGIAWVAVAVALSSTGGFALLAFVVAGAVVLLHPASDLRERVIAVGLQEAACIGLFFAESSKYNRAPITDSWRDTWDGFVTFHANPLRFGEEIVVHLRRVAETFPGGPPWFAAICIFAAIFGLALLAWRGRQAVRARFLLLVFLVAFVGGLLAKFPFGPEVTSPISDGHRVSLWLIPVLAVGLGALLQGLRSLLARRRILRIAFDAAAYLGAAAVLVSALSADALPYPYPGARSATEYVESHLGPQDALLVPWPAQYSFAWQTDLSVGVQADPGYHVGFVPKFSDPRIHLTDIGVSSDAVAQSVQGADRVLIYNSDPDNSEELEAIATYTKTLKSLGFAQERIAHFQDVKVEVWRRGQPEPRRQPARSGQQFNPNQVNLRLADLPKGWEETAPPPAPPSTSLYACLHVPAAQVPSLVAFTDAQPGQALFAVSELAKSPSSAAARDTYKALNGPRAARCIESATRSALQNLRIRVSVTAKRVKPPPAGGNPAVAYKETVRVRKSPLGQGTVVFFAHGRIGVLIGGLGVGERAFSSDLLSSIAGSVAGRVNAAAQKGR
jgi:hypothetical protein